MLLNYLNISNLARSISLFAYAVSLSYQTSNLIIFSLTLVKAESTIADLVVPIISDETIGSSQTETISEILCLFT